MEKKEQDKINTFDAQFTTNQIQLFKILLSYMDPSVQKNFVLYIKFMELKYTITLLKDHSFVLFRETAGNANRNSSAILEEIIPFCDKAQQENIRQYQNMMQTFENVQSMMETMEMMKELFPDTMGGSENAGGTPFSFANMEDMMNLFTMMQGTNPQES